MNYELQEILALEADQQQRKIEHVRHKDVIILSAAVEILKTLDGFKNNEDPSDSAQLYELRAAIDTHLGWEFSKQQEEGDYLKRVARVGLQLEQGVQAEAALRRANETIEQLKAELRDLRRQTEPDNR